MRRQIIDPEKREEYLRHQYGTRDEMIGEPPSEPPDDHVGGLVLVVSWVVLWLLGAGAIAVTIIGIAFVAGALFELGRRVMGSG